MKIKSEHYQHIQNAFNELSYSLGNTGHDLSDLKKDYLSKGLTLKRFRWDLLYRCNLSAWICSNLYPYLNDNHIDTALRRITEDY